MQAGALRISPRKLLSGKSYSKTRPKMDKPHRFLDGVTKPFFTIRTNLPHGWRRSFGRSAIWTTCNNIIPNELCSKNQNAINFLRNLSSKPEEEEEKWKGWSTESATVA